ncbi:MAG: LysR family substrate-binding domain-containing protein [Actinomycetales bacterium]
MPHSDQQSSQLRVAFVPGVTPGKWIRRWEERMPAVELVTFLVPQEQQLAVLADGRADLSFVRLPVDKTGLHVIPLYTEIPVVVAPRDHEIAVFEEVPVAELSAEYLLQDPDTVPEWRDISDQLREGTRAPLPPMASVEEALDLVEAGLGILILPMSVARHFNRKELRYRPVTGMAETALGLAWPIEDGPGGTDPVIEEFIGVVRGRSARSSRQPSVQAKQAVPKSKRTAVPARTNRTGKSHAARRRRK